MFLNFDCNINCILVKSKINRQKLTYAGFSLFDNDLKYIQKKEH